MSPAKRPPPSPARPGMVVAVVRAGRAARAAAELTIPVAGARDSRDVFSMLVDDADESFVDSGFVDCFRAVPLLAKGGAGQGPSGQDLLSKELRPSSRNS